MTIQDLGSIGELIGAVATIATLVYLALQIRQNTQSVRIAAEMDVSHQFADWCGRVVEDPNLGRIWDAASVEPETLTEDEQRIYLWYVAQIFSYYEGLYHLFVKGHIAPGTWEPKADFLQVLLKQSLVDTWWRARIAPFSNEFFEYIDHRRETVEVAEPNKNVMQRIHGLLSNNSLEMDA